MAFECREYVWTLKQPDPSQGSTATVTHRSNPELSNLWADQSQGMAKSQFEMGNQLTGNPDKSEYFLAGLKDGGASILPSKTQKNTVL